MAPRSRTVESSATRNLDEKRGAVVRARPGAPHPGTHVSDVRICSRFEKCFDHFTMPVQRRFHERCTQVHALGGNALEATRTRPGPDARCSRSHPVRVQPRRELPLGRHGLRLGQNGSSAARFRPSQHDCLQWRAVTPLPMATRTRVLAAAGQQVMDGTSDTFHPDIDRSASMTALVPASGTNSGRGPLGASSPPRPRSTVDPSHILFAESSESHSNGAPKLSRGPLLCVGAMWPMQDTTVPLPLPLSAHPARSQLAQLDSSPAITP